MFRYFFHKLALLDIETEQILLIINRTMLSLSTNNFARRVICRGRPSIGAAFHQQQNSASTLVIAEPSSDESALAPSTLSAISAASKLHSGPISLLTFSSGDVSVPSSVSSVIKAKVDGDHSSLLAETVTNAVVAANEKYGYSHIVTAGTKFGANYLGRAGAQLGVSPVSDVVEVLSEGMLYLCVVLIECFIAKILLQRLLFTARE